MIYETKIRTTRKDPNKDEETTKYETGLLNKAHVISAINAGMPGVLAVKMINGETLLIKDTMKGFIKK